MNPANCPRLTPLPRPVSGTWYRAVAPRFLSNPISTSHSKTVASRFSAASPAHSGFEILYLAEKPQVALFEVGALYGSPLSGVVVNPQALFRIVAIQVHLSGMVDVSKPAEAAKVYSNAQELTGDWRCYRERGRLPGASVKVPTGKAPTQKFGEQLYALCPNVQGFVTLSARLPYFKILGIFTRRLKAGSSDYISYTDPSGTHTPVRIP